jgi:DNA-binding GntR family transcriptional regulator
VSEAREPLELAVTRVTARDFGYDQVYRSLRRALLSQAILPGTRLVEVDLAAGLGVSRTPVREALRRLESEGIVIRGHGGGLEAVLLTSAEVADAFLIRTEIERLAARLASQRANAADWDEVRGRVATMELAIVDHGKTSDEFKDRHLEVHASIYRLAFGDRMAKVLSNNVLHYSDIAADLSYNSVPDRSLDPGPQHYLLIAELASGDPARAAAAAVEHVRRSAMDAGAAPDNGAA